MAKINKHIEIVVSTKPGLSSMGVASRTAIQALLFKRYARVDITIVNNMSDLVALVAREPDLVFLGMKFLPHDPVLGRADAHKIWLSEYLDRAGITYTGSEHDAMGLELKKELAKQRLLDMGLATAPFMVVEAGKELEPDDVALTYPLFVKPTDRGAGAGVDAGSLVYGFQQLRAKVRSLAAGLRADALVEEYLSGREFSVGILKQEHTNNYAVMPLELVAPADKSGARYLSSRVKAADSEYHLPVTDGAVKSKINELAISAFHALGARDYGRIDIRLDKNGTPRFLEANLLPSLLEGYGNFPKTFLLNMRLNHEAIILTIVNLAFLRKQDQGGDLADVVVVPEIAPSYLVSLG